MPRDLASVPSSCTMQSKGQTHNVPPARPLLGWGGGRGKRFGPFLQAPVYKRELPLGSAKGLDPKHTHPTAREPAREGQRRGSCPVAGPRAGGHGPPGILTGFYLY